MAFEITDEVIRQVEALAANGLSEEQIGSVIGVSRSTIQRKTKENESFESAIKRGRHKGVAKVANALFQKAINGDNVAMIFFLKNRDSGNWKDRVEQKIETTETVSKIEIQVIDSNQD